MTPKKYGTFSLRLIIVGMIIMFLSPLLWILHLTSKQTADYIGTGGIVLMALGMVGAIYFSMYMETLLYQNPQRWRRGMKPKNLIIKAKYAGESKAWLFDHLIEIGLDVEIVTEVDNFIPKSLIQAKINELDVCEFINCHHTTCTLIEFHNKNCKGKDRECEWFQQDNEETIEIIESLLGDDQ